MALFPKLKCPWCGEIAVAFGINLGSRRATTPTKWYQVTRTIRTCAHCARPVKFSKGGASWLLLVIRAGLTLSDASNFSRGILLLSLASMVAGVFMYSHRTTLEKDNAI